MQLNSILLKFFKRFTTTLIITVLFSSTSAFAYLISYDINTSYGGNLQYTTNPGSFSLSDSWNQYSEASYNLVSLTGDGTGGVNTEWDYYGTGWDSYASGLSLSFEILSEYGNSTPTPVSVDIFGFLFFDSQQEWAFPYADSCCAAGSSVSLGIHDISTLESDIIFSEYNSGDNGGRQIIRSGVVDDTFTLLTNTIYDFNLGNYMYVETDGARYPPSHFSTWEEFNTFISFYEGSVSATSSAYGFINYEMEITSVEETPSSVPEPSIYALISAGLVGLGFARRKAKK